MESISGSLQFYMIRLLLVASLLLVAMHLVTSFLLLIVNKHPLANASRKDQAAVAAGQATQDRVSVEVTKANRATGLLGLPELFGKSKKALRALRVKGDLHAVCAWFPTLVATSDVSPSQELLDIITSTPAGGFDLQASP